MTATVLGNRFNHLIARARLLVASGTFLCACGGMETAPPGATPDAGGVDALSEVIEEDDPSIAIDEYIRGLSELPVLDESIAVAIGGTPVEDGDYECTEQYVEETKQFDSLTAYVADPELLWPGALVRGDSIYGGQFAAIALERAPVQVALSLENGMGNWSAVVPDPSFAEYKDALDGILTSAVGAAIPTDPVWEMRQVYDKGQLTLALGGDISWVPGGVAANFDFAAEDVHSRYLVKFQQAYYTVELEQPSRPSDVFADSVTLDEVKDAAWEENPPVYISSLTYGRMVLFTFESPYSATEMGAALQFAFSDEATDANAAVNVTSDVMLDGTKMAAYVVDGSGAVVTRTFASYAQLRHFLRTDAEFSLTSPGAPISYKLAYLGDNSQTLLSFTAGFEQTICERIKQRVHVGLTGIYAETVNDTLYAYGDLTASYGDDDYTIAEFSEDETLTLAEGETWPSSPDSVGEVMNVKPEAGATIDIKAKLWDRDTVWGTLDWLAKDDLLGDETISLPFEEGWRREETIYFSGDDSSLVITLAITPVRTLRE